MSTEPTDMQQPSITTVRIVSVDIPIGEVFTLVLRFGFAALVVGGVLALIVWAIAAGLRTS